MPCAYPLAKWAFLLLFTIGIGLPAAANARSEPAGCLNPHEAELAALVNEYRAENGRPKIPVSKALTRVAQWHNADTAHANDVLRTWGKDPRCNLHSWYGVPGSSYEKCCYTADHAKAACMWDKPYELSGGAYPGAGFENAAVGYASPKAALAGWKSSDGHDRVILNKGMWKSYTWKAMGVGVDPVHKSYYLWFGLDADPARKPPTCPAVQCPAKPDPSCVDSFDEATLVLDDRVKGRERLVAKWRGGPTLRSSHLGNPRDRGGTEYATCLYDDRGTLAAEYRVGAAGKRCGGTSCWKNFVGPGSNPKHLGYKYLDKASRRDGIRFMRLKASSSGGSNAVVRGVNNAELGRRDLPTGAVDALRNSTRATIQLHGSNAPLCLSARLDKVVARGKRLFEARK